MANEVGGASAGGSHAHVDVQAYNLLLPAGELGADPHAAPVAPVHAGGVQRRRHRDASALRGPVTQKLEPGVAQVAVAHPRHLHALNGDEALCVIDAPQGHHNLHGPARGLTPFACQEGLLLRRQEHPSLPLPPR